MKRNSGLFFILCAIALFLLPSSYALALSGLKIGLAKVKITPEEPTILAGYSHGTNAMCYPPSDIVDDIYCRIMVAEDGSGNREVFLSMDVCVYMENDYYDPYNGVGVWWPKTVPQGTTQRFAVAGDVGIDRVFVSATHTHQASEQLAEKYIQRIVDGINTARNNMIAVNVGYANTTYNINVNRRPDFGVHPNLECDKSLVLAIFRKVSDNTPVASVVNYAVHNTVSNLAINKCSTELTGYAMNKIESNYGGGFISLFFQGFEGDVGPNIDGLSYVDYERSVSAGNTFGQNCTDILNSISVSSNPVTINGATSSQSLSTKPDWGVSSQGVNFAAARIGDICFIGGSGEIFNQMGISLKLQSPFGANITTALVNGYSGYVPTLSGFYDGVGGSEVTSKCPWTSIIEDIYMTEMSKLVSSMAGGTSLLGYSSIGGNAEITSANTLTVSKFNAGANMTLNNLKIYVQNATGKVRLGLFSDNGMDSFTLLQQTGEITLSNGWNEGTITSTNIGPGTYWIGFVFSDSGNTVYYDSRKLGSYSQSCPFGPLPSKPSGMNWGGGIYSLYAGTGGTIVPVTGVSVSPTSATVYINAKQQLTATISPSNATNKTVSWSSGNTSVATVNSTGLVTGIAAGNTTITATTQDGGKTATCVVTVPDGGGSVIGLNKIGSVAETGNSGYWGATSFTALSDVTVNRMNLYVTSASGKARLGIYSSNSGEPGTLLAQTGEITLSNGWNSGILGSPQNLTSGSVYWLALEVNSSLTTLYSDFASGRLRYISYTYGAMPSAAPTGCASGDRIYSIYADNSNGGGPVVVTGISVSPTSATISVNGTLQLTAAVLPSDATNKSVSWSSGNTSVATVNSTGLVTGIASGSANIMVTSQDGGKTATCVITVPGGGGSVMGLNEVGNIGETGNSGYWGATSFTALSNITVNRMNLYVTSASGKARLGIYSSSSGEPGTLLAQTGEISLSNGWNSGILGSPQNLTSGSVYWLALEVNSSLTTLYSNSAPGRLRYISFTYGAMPSAAPTGCASGDRIYSIYADNSNGGPVAVTSVSVSPTSAAISVNGTLQLAATVLPSDATNKSVSWISGNTSVATVSSTGLVTGKAAGSTVITVTTQDGGKTATSNMSVIGGTVAVTGVSVSPTLATISVNGTQQLTATVSPSDATNKTVSWSSGNTSVATVSSTGIVTGIAAGNAIITVTTQDGGKTATSNISVNGGTVAVTGVSVSPTLATISVNGTQQLTATVSPANATNKTVSWSSGNTSVATVSSTGIVTGIAAGNAIITVTTQDGGKTATSNISVNGGTVAVTGVSVSPTLATISVNGTQQLTATVSPANATNKTVSWSSGNTSVATVSSTGIVTGIAAGNAIITVTTQDGSKKATSAITVSTIRVTSVYVSPTSATISINGTKQLTATVLPSNATNKTVSWSSGNTSVATVNSNGLVTGIAAGYATIRVTTQDGSKRATSAITVKTIRVTGVSVSPTSATIPVNGTQQLTATISPANATNKTVSWSSGNTSVATVNSTGLVKGVASGSVTIKITTQDGGKIATSAITVSSILKGANLNESVKERNLDIGSQNQFVVFPNPNNIHVLYIKLALVNERAIINITDLNGRVIYSKSFVGTGSTQQLDIGGLKPGIYLVAINQGDARYNCKLIVE